MTLSSDITALATRAGAECRSLRVLINGNASGLTALNTAAKGSLVAAINEVYATVQAGAGDATTTTKGVVRFATEAEAYGTSQSLALSPGAIRSQMDAKPDSDNLGYFAFGSDASELTGVLPTSVLPPLAINDTFAPADQAAMLALTAQRGDIAIRQDTGVTFVLAAEGASTLANWKEILSAGKVVSVAGRTGAVVLTKADVGLSNVDNTSDASKPVSTATQTALNAKEPTITGGSTGQYWRGDKTWQTLDKATVGLSNVDNTSDVNKPVSTATQTALNAKVSTTATETIAGVKTFSSAPVVPDASFAIAKTNGLQAALDGKSAVGHTHTLTDIPTSPLKRNVRAATTASIALSGTPTIDGIALVAGDRILAKDQISNEYNGIYIIAAGAWSRATDASTAAMLCGAEVVVESGGQAGQRFTTTFAAGATLGVTPMPWYRSMDASTGYTKTEIGPLNVDFAAAFNAALV